MQTNWRELEKRNLFWFNVFEARKQLDKQYREWGIPKPEDPSPSELFSMYWKKWTTPLDQDTSAEAMELKERIVRHIAIMLRKPEEKVREAFGSHETKLFYYEKATDQFGISRQSLDSLVRVAKKVDCTVFDFTGCKRIDPGCTSEFFEHIYQLKKLKKVVLPYLPGDELQKKFPAIQITGEVKQTVETEQDRILSEERRRRVVHCASLVLHTKNKEAIERSLTPRHMESFWGLMDEKFLVDRDIIRTLAYLAAMSRATVFDFRFFSANPDLLDYFHINVPMFPKCMTVIHTFENDLQIGRDFYNAGFSSICHAVWLDPFKTTEATMPNIKYFRAREGLTDYRILNPSTDPDHPENGLLYFRSPDCFPKEVLNSLIAGGHVSAPPVAPVVDVHTLERRQRAIHCVSLFLHQQKAVLERLIIQYEGNLLTSFKDGKFLVDAEGLSAIIEIAIKCKANIFDFRVFGGNIFSFLSSFGNKSKHLPKHMMIIHTNEEDCNFLFEKWGVKIIYSPLRLDPFKTEEPKLPYVKYISAIIDGKCVSQPKDSADLDNPDEAYEYVRYLPAKPGVASKPAVPQTSVKPVPAAAVTPAKKALPPIPVKRGVAQAPQEEEAREAK